MKSRLTQAQRDMIQLGAERNESLRTIARTAHTSQTTVARVLGQSGKKVERVRRAKEFGGAVAVEAPVRRTGPYGWGLEAIRTARDMQMRGDFSLPVRLAEAMRTDDALYVAYHNRIAPQASVETRLVPRGDDSRSASAQRRAESSVFVSRAVLGGIEGTMANHGIAIGYIEREVSEDGTRVDMSLTEWPLEHCRYNTGNELLETQIRGGMRIPIVHGDGTWIRFQKFDVLPWANEAAVLPGALIWAAHAYAMSDWAGASKSHGQAKIVGKLPQGVAIQGLDANGALVLGAEAKGFLQMLQDIVTGETGAALAPFGSETQFLSNGSTAWQVFSELIQNREKAAARIYLGTDAILGSVGGAPGVDIATLFAVASTKLQGDFDAIEQGLNTGLYQPWAAINLGDSRYAPRFAYQLPDPDAAGKSKERGEAYDRLFAAITNMRANHLRVDQSVIDRLCAAFGVQDVPVLDVPVAPPIAPAVPPKPENPSNPKA